MLNLLLALLRDLLLPRRDLLLENLALRQQILVLQRTNPKPPFRDRDRAFWVILRQLWDGWRRPLRLVQPETVIRWHRKSWRMWWRWKSKPLQQAGRPRIPWEVIELIRRISRENPTWGAPRIHGELMKLGYFLHESTVARYMVKRRGRPAQNWKTFLRNHLHETAAIDFLIVPTVTFRTLYVFVVLSLDRRRIVHLNVTEHPTAEWTALQLRQAFMFDTAPRFLLRDHDKIYGNAVVEALDQMGIEQIVTAVQSPWQNGYCERVVGTLKRECLNHVIVFNEAHARRILRGYLEYYHGSRTHLGLDKDAPDGRTVEPPALGPVRRRPMVGGLHSRYYRAAA
ncbi:MAG: transposase family protein [Armatimonadetes bacterium]|nr:transposase family protein [Armatimonadota bacterium]